ncbi:hypothetical protein NP233_g1802 [Leucocoprinus birnbaumii]|uniref:Uncharacterized protein n=1 Tax=Leucocoprinus birnbaumii TaxID=56174 RepID=A0AAD5YUI0_9AGAR|nr:hypothetical protein NP233_g1802 [Leucocoprinus birnbaumii]
MPAVTQEILSYEKEQLEAHGFIIGMPHTKIPPGSPKQPEDFPNFVAGNANIASGLIASIVNVNTTDSHSGSGWAVGIGEGLDVTAGLLGYGSWDTLKSKENNIIIVAEVDVLTITFLVDGSVAAVFTGGGVGEVTFEGYGWFNWN